MASTVELVKEKLDIADFIRGYVPLMPAGKNLKGLCPFHKEKTPSFIVSPERQSWHCFGCGIGGDAIAFLMRYESLEFIEALKVLAERTGVEMRSAASSEERQYSVLYEINQVAKDFFRNQLESQTAAAEVARTYLKERGLKQETIHEFELGFTPNASDALSRHLSKSGFKIQDIERAGLIFKTERGTYWDRFRGRIMFPFSNAFGKTVGFTGRLMPGAEETAAGKYVNSPETPVFNKSKLLYGFHKTKNAIREARIAVLVEGQMDFLMTWQDGVKNVTATSGTALTLEHLKPLKRLADTLVVAFDADEAGQAATERVIDLAGAHDFSVKVISFAKGGNDPDGGRTTTWKDPDDIVRESPGTMAKLIFEAEPAMQHYFNRYLVPVFAAKRGMVSAQDIASVKRSVRMVLSKIKVLASHVEQSHWLQELSAVSGISETHLTAELGVLPSSNQKIIVPPSEAAHTILDPEFSRGELISQRLLSLALVDLSLKEELRAHLRFMPEAYAAISRSVVLQEAETLPPHLVALADLISLRSSLELAEPTVMKNEFQTLLQELKREYYRGEQSALGTAIREAERAGDEARLAAALNEFHRVSQEFDRISRETYNA
jgi:DNA primase